MFGRDRINWPRSRLNLAVFMCVCVCVCLRRKVTQHCNESTNSPRVSGGGFGTLLGCLDPYFGRVLIGSFSVARFVASFTDGGSKRTAGR